MGDNYFDQFFKDIASREGLELKDDGDTDTSVIADVVPEDDTDVTTTPPTDPVGPCSLRLGVWWDIGGPNTTKYLNDHLRRIKDLNLSTVTVMVNKVGDTNFGFTLFSAERLVEFAQALKSIGVGLVLDSWIHPTRRYIGDLVSQMPEVAEQCHAKAIEFDSEGLWQNSTVSGYSSLESAGQDLFARLRPLTLAKNMNIGVTVHTGRINPTLSNHADFVAVQCYTIWKAEYAADPLKRRNYGIGGVWGPSKRPLLGYRQAKDMNGPQPIIGLAAWGQTFPGVPPAISMALALDAVKTLPADLMEVRYWSWKWIGGSDAKIKNVYAYDFIKAIEPKTPLV